MGDGFFLVCYYDVSELYDPVLFEEAMRALPWAERRNKVERFHFLKDKCLCLGAGLLCAHLLRMAGATDLAVGYGEQGKPYLIHHPNIHFNLSHSGTLAACVVSSAPVGIDVEECQPYERGVAKMCFTSDELAWLDEQEDAERAFVRLWTRKESYLKLLGSGLSKPPNSFTVLPDTYLKHTVRFWEYHLAGYELCICERANKVEETIRGEERSLQEMPSFRSMVTEDL